MNNEQIPADEAVPFAGLEALDLPKHVKYHRGKVRDLIPLDHTLLITCSDRVSAFDRVLDVVPDKGELLSRLSSFWFRQTADIIENHLVREVTGRTVLVRHCTPLPVEVVVRGYLSGSAWRDYQAGRPVSGVVLPSGLRMNDRLPEPILTPSTKEQQGGHDRPIGRDELLAAGLVAPQIWEQVERAALSLFERGSAHAAGAGLILVDTKYEFGLLDERLLLIDELHTPDSSRYWYADTYEQLLYAGERQRMLDKEYLRQWLMEHGFRGDGKAPPIPPEIITELSSRYRTAFERLTGTEFRPKATSSEAERTAILSLLDEGV